MSVVWCQFDEWLKLPILGLSMLVELRVTGGRGRLLGPAMLILSKRQASRQPLFCKRRCCSKQSSKLNLGREYKWWHALTVEEVRIITTLVETNNPPHCLAFTAPQSFTTSPEPPYYLRTYKFVHRSQVGRKIRRAVRDAKQFIHHYEHAPAIPGT